jgi:hypothetical protein
MVIDINVNGTSIWTAAAGQLTIAAASTGGAVTVIDTMYALTAGALLTLDIDQIGSSTAGDDLTVVLNIQET